MAMIDPPIEKVIEKAGSRYALCTVVTKRAKELLLEQPEYFKQNMRVKPIEVASKEFYEGKYDLVKTTRK
ncbi:MAG: DNA-directed RNA polymerase subunit omega [Clostridia bacterium]|nr:DNA-directed RNA polymerase subunit omega [Clostridia bacterium]